MSLYKQWTDMVVEYVKEKGEDAFWAEYMDVETRIYKELLANHAIAKVVTIEAFAKEFDTTQEFVMGFLDGINDSLKTSYELDDVTAKTEITLDMNLEGLYYNMLDARAEYLYELAQWDGIFSVEKREEIATAYKKSKTVVNEPKVGRNDACPCGSGKKYKKCCGK